MTFWLALRLVGMMEWISGQPSDARSKSSKKELDKESPIAII